MIMKVATASVRPSVPSSGIDRINADRSQHVEQLDPHDVDWLDLSEAAQAEPTKPAIRDDLVQKLRQSIASGEYLTNDRIDAAVEGLHGELFGNR